jgi:hypothetical protein
LAFIDRGATTLFAKGYGDTYPTKEEDDDPVHAVNV